MHYVLVGAFIVLGLAGGATLLFGDKMLAGTSAKLSNWRLQAQVLDNQQSALAQAKRDVAKYTPLNTIAQTVVPQEKNQALAVREIIGFAAQSKITISSITFPASNLGGTGLTSTGVKTTPIVSPVPSQLTPAPGLSGIYVLPITVQSDITKPIGYAQLSTFLQALERNRHTAEVSQLTITPSDSGGKTLSFEVIINIYIKR